MFHFAMRGLDGASRRLYNYAAIAASIRLPIGFSMPHQMIVTNAKTGRTINLCKPLKSVCKSLKKIYKLLKKVYKTR